jgi:hypothetical protein
MKKVSLTIIAILSIVQVSHAQWTTTGNNIFNSNTGNVGIGVTAPSSLLTVGGNFSSGGNHQVSVVSAPTATTGLFTGIASQLTVNSSATSDGAYYAFLGQIGTLNTPSNLTSALGLIAFGGSVIHRGTGTVTGAASLFAGGVSASNGGTVTNGYGVYISPVKGTGVTNGYGVYQAATGDNNYFAGNVGIGTTTPAATLTVVNSTPLIQLFDKESNPADGSSEGKIAFGSAGGAEWASIEASRAVGSADDVTALKFKTSWATGAGGDGTNIERMRISPSGNVGIGIANPQNKLDVNGTIHSKAVNIDLNGWNDYVFKKDYQLRPLSEVKAYIDQNQHLPEIPAEREMIKNGLDVGEMNKLLMKKVEELTLYLIEENKAKKEQETINSKQQTQIDELIKQVQDLKKQIK